MNHLRLVINYLALSLDYHNPTCKSCDNYLWIQAFVLKKISALVSPSGQEALIPVQVYSCGNCGKVAEGMLEGSGVDDQSSFPTLDV